MEEPAAALFVRSVLTQSFCLSPDADWNYSVYNSRNGGSVSAEPGSSAAAAFFRSAAGAAQYAHRVRYVVARYGWSSSIFGWELWNELTNAFTPVAPACKEATSGLEWCQYNRSREDVERWHAEQRATLRQLDLSRHMISTSFPSLTGDAVIEATMEFSTTHMYDKPDMARSLGGLAHEKVLRFDKPSFIGECGVHPQEDDPTGISLENALWAPVFRQAAGGSACWFWNYWVPHYRLYNKFASVSKFITESQVPWAKMDWRAENHTRSFIPPGAIVTGMAGGRLGTPVLDQAATIAVLFMHSENYTWVAQNRSAPLREIESTTLKLHGMAHGCYDVRWFSSTAGQWLGNTTRLCSDSAEAGDLRLPTVTFRTNVAAVLAPCELLAAAKNSDQQSTDGGLKTDDDRIAMSAPIGRWRNCRPYFTSSNGRVIYSNPVRSQCGPHDSYTVDTLVPGPDSPCDAPGVFPIFWNVGGCSIYDANQRCNASTRDPLPVDVTTFGILPFNYTQTNIPTLHNSQNWQPDFRSLMPVVALNGSGALINGGVPQNGNLSEFVRQLRVQVPGWIPDEQWSGNAVFDFEAWSTVWELNTGADAGWHGQVYQNLSLQLVQAHHPTWTEAQVEAQAKVEFEAAATEWFVTALEVCSQIRPHAKWGWYGVPQGSAPVEFGQRQLPIFLASGALYPSGYDYGDCSGSTSESKAHHKYVTTLVAQTVALADKVFAARPGRSRPPPVYMFASEVCRAAGPPILTQQDLRTSLVAPYAAGATGVIIWGMPAGDMAEVKLNSTEYWANVKAVTGPIAQEVSESAERCAVEHCSGNGRCVALPNVETTSHETTALTKCTCNVPFSGAACAVNRCVNSDGFAVASCYGWDEVDSTEALNLALSDPMVSTLIVDKPLDPAAGWTTQSLFITRNDLTVIFQDGVLLQAREGYFRTVDGDQASLLTLFKVRNVSLIGEGNATLRMRRADYTNASMGYTEHSEWRHGINLLHVRDIRIKGLRVEDTGGDGIYVLGESDIHISDCVLNSNFRQGMSVINASNLLVERTTFSNTDGTPPMAGVDLEPDSHCMMLNNITFIDCIADGNSGFGWILSPQMLNASSRPLSIVVENLNVVGGPKPPPKDAAHPSWRPAMGIGITGVNEAGADFGQSRYWGTGSLGGSVVIRNSTVRDTWGCGFFATSKGSHAASLLVENVHFDNVQRQVEGKRCPAPVSSSCPPPAGSYAVPIEVGGNSDSCFETGGIRFANCSVADAYDRPFLVMDNVAGKCAKTTSGEWGVANISGTFAVSNPFGCKYSKPTNETNIALTVDCKKWPQ